MYQPSSWNADGFACMQVYEGYDLWGRDMRMPDFTNCSVTYHGRKAGRACHPKSLVKPLAADLMNVHFQAGTAPGFDEVPLAVDPNVAYIKHLRQVYHPKHSFLLPKMHILAA